LKPDVLKPDVLKPDVLWVYLFNIVPFIYHKSLPPPSKFCLRKDFSDQEQKIPGNPEISRGIPGQEEYILLRQKYSRGEKVMFNQGHDTRLGTKII
jgi:hypothetical protein